MKDDLLELVRTGQRRCGPNQSSSMRTAPLYERAMREEWAKMPVGPDLVAMRPMNGALPTVGYQKTQKRRGKIDLCRIGIGPTKTVVWTVSTGFMGIESPSYSSSTLRTAQQSASWAVL